MPLSRFASGCFSISPVLCLRLSGVLSLVPQSFASLCRRSSFNLFRNSRSITCKWRESFVIWKVDWEAETLFLLIEFLGLSFFRTDAFSWNEFNLQAADRLPIRCFDLFVQQVACSLVSFNFRFNSSPNWFPDSWPTDIKWSKFPQDEFWCSRLAVAVSSRLSAANRPVFSSDFDLLTLAPSMNPKVERKIEIVSFRLRLNFVCVRVWASERPMSKHVRHR